jgi:hypothetical protein
VFVLTLYKLHDSVVGLGDDEVVRELRGMNRARVFRHESGGERRRESVDMTGKAGQGLPRAEDDAMHDWHAGFTVRTVRLHPSSLTC